MNKYFLVTNSLQGSEGWQDAPYDMLYGYEPRLYKSEAAAIACATKAQNDTSNDWAGDVAEFSVSEVTEQEAQFMLGFGPEWDREEPQGGIGA